MPGQNYQEFTLVQERLKEVHLYHAAKHKQIDFQIPSVNGFSATTSLMLRLVEFSLAVIAIDA